MEQGQSKAYTFIPGREAGAGLRGIERNDHSAHDWVFILVIAGFALLAFVQVFYHRRLKMIFQAVYAKHYASQLVREGNIFNERISVVLFLIYLISFSLFIFESLKLFSASTGFYPDFKFLLILVGIIVLFWLLKVIFIKVTGIIFTTRERSFDYLLNIIIINVITGLFLLGILLPMIYLDAKIFFYIGFGFLCLMFFYKLIKGVAIGFSYTKFSRFHLFLYLCTLEILPLVLLVKFLSTKI